MGQLNYSQQSVAALAPAIEPSRNGGLSNSHKTKRPSKFWLVSDQCERAARVYHDKQEAEVWKRRLESSTRVLWKIKAE